MGIVNGPFPQVTFCGASVTSFTSTVGWNEQSSSVTIGLVEDPSKGQHFTFPEMGIPLKFVYEGFEFQGIVQRWLEKNATDGKPTYEVALTDPREILAGTQVILSSYRGDVGRFANLLNAFGYWEDVLGFGGALTNESGMVWNSTFDILGITDTPSGGSITITPVGQIGIMPAIETMTKSGNIFGGPLRFRGYEYSVDLSALPVPPSYYRMGGVSSSILEMVSEICQDGGHDFICTLNKNVIGFKTVSRVQQPDPGQIANFINSSTNVTNSSIGVELRNNITNAIILGGDITQLIQEYNPDNDDTIWPYWGTYLDGTVIVGDGQPEVGQTFNLNAAPITDIIGDIIYPCDIIEMRTSLMDFDSWAYYVLKFFPDKANVINLISAIDSESDLNELFPDTIFVRDIIDDSQNAVTLFGPMNDEDYWTKRAQRVYEFVRQYATDFFGKKFLVKIPFFIYYKLEPETTNIIKSDEPTDAGYQIDGSMPLGLAYLNENIFMSEDGRFQCFVLYSDVEDADLQKLSADSYITQGTNVYVKASVDMDIGIVYPGGSIYPYCVVTVDSPLYEQADCPLGTMEDIAQLLEYDNVEQLQLYAAGLRHDSFPLKIHPGPYRPNAVAIPMKSNRDSYGPWFTSGGVDGKVSFTRDEGLVPWNYGDFNTMNLAAQAKLANAATQMQYLATGSVDVAGSPDFSLGDTLVGGGPELTGINVSIGSNGVTTNYRMETFTPRFGVFTAENADRLRRLGTAAQQMRRAVRNLYQRSLAIDQIFASAELGFMANTSRAVRQQTPHQCLLTTMSYDNTYNYRTQVSTMTAPELVANCRGDDDDIWPCTALMTMEGLLRPFSTNSQRQDDDPLNDMPHYEAVTNMNVKITCTDLDPFSDGNDIDYMAWGDTYPGNVHTLKSEEVDYTNARLLGLRGPLVMVGWAYTYTGKPVPNPKDDGKTPEQNWSNSFITDYRSHMEEWKAGPVGLYWDNWRKIWTIPTVLFGILQTSLSANASGLMNIAFKSDGTGGPSDQVNVVNWLGGATALPSGTMVCAAYYQQINQWIIISAKCPTTS